MYSDDQRKLFLLNPVLEKTMETKHEENGKPITVETGYS